MLLVYGVLLCGALGGCAGTSAFENARLAGLASLPKEEATKRDRPAAGELGGGGAKAKAGCFRNKQIVGGRLRGVSLEAQKAEALVACDVLNQMLELGRPESYAVPG